MSAISIDKLTYDEKVELIERLVDSLDATLPPIPEGHREALERRLETIDADIANSTPWEDFDLTLRQRFG